MPLLQVQAGTATQNFSTLYDTLDTVKQQMLEGNLDNFINVATLIGGLGALFYMAYRVWGSLARAEPVDVFPLLRPFALGLLIMNFGWVTGFLDTVISPIEAATTAMVSEGQDDLDSSRKKLEEARQKKNRQDGKAYLNGDEEKDKALQDLGLWDKEYWEIQFEAKTHEIEKNIVDFFHTAMAWIVEAVKLAIATVSTFFLIMLSIFGPLVFGFACFDGFGHGLTAWISRYISISLWVPVCDVLSTILNKIEVLMNNIDLQTLQGAAGGDETASKWFFIVFYIIALIAYSTVPTVAGWIVEAGGGAGALGNKVAGVGNSIAKVPAMAVGGAVGGTIGLGFNLAKTAIAGKMIGRQISKSMSQGGGKGSSEKDSTGSAPQG